MNLTLCTTTEIRDIRAEATPGQAVRMPASLVLYQDGWNMLVHIMDGSSGAFERFQRIAAIFNETAPAEAQISSAAEKNPDDSDIVMSR